MDESGIVKCPECDGEMEKGYLVSEAIRWSTQRHPQWALGQDTIVHGYAWAFTNTEAFPFTNQYTQRKEQSESSLSLDPCSFREKMGGP
jgi:hypothetical protein